VRSEFLPFSTPTIEDAEINEVVDSLKSGWITTGPKVKRFEDEFKAYVGAPFAVPLSSATAGLHLVLLALGIKEGDEIITTPMTFASTVSIPVLCGAKPVLVDIEPGTLNIDVARIREKITPRTKAIIPVHFAGQSCDMDPIFALAKEFGLTVIEDAAHAAGTEYKGTRIGTLDSISIFSFHPNKNMTTGEGGMVCTPDETVAEEVSLLKFHGMSREAWKRFAASGTPNYDIVMPGFKYNMMDIQAAIGIHQLPKLDRFIDRRKEIAEFYNREFADVPELALPAYAPYEQRHAWHLYTPLVRVEMLSIDRDGFMAELKKENIGTGLHYKAVHHHAWYREHLPQAAGSLPNADYASDRILSLPLFPKMSDNDAADVVTAVKSVIARTRK
jgi:dTDP-4-amino-4,6-dideoxygalactose transaminase